MNWDVVTLESWKKEASIKVELVAGFIDWLDLGSHSILVTLGLQPSGDLNVLHVSLSPRNDFKSAHQHLEVIRPIGFGSEKPALFVINGSTCLRHIVPGILGDQIVLQRCQLRCVEELAQALPEEEAKGVGPKFKEFFESTYSSSQAKVKDWNEQIHNHFPTVAANFMENSEETMTIHRMEVPMPLRLTLSTTSMIWQQPPGLLGKLKQAFAQEGTAEESLPEVISILEKRMRDISPIVGFEDLWLLEPALKEEVKLINPIRHDYVDLFAEDKSSGSNSADPRKVRRRHKRWEVSEINGFVHHTIEADILNIGVTGLACETQVPLAIGGKHNIRLKHRNGEVTLVGKVAWSRLKKSIRETKGAGALVYHTGMEFENTLSTEGREVRFFFDSMAKIDVNRRVFGRFQYAEEISSDNSIVNLRQLVPFKVLKISFSGMLIQTESLPEEELLSLEVQVGTDKMKVLGRVINSEKKEDVEGSLQVGIEFKDLSEESKVVLARMIQKAIEN